MPISAEPKIIIPVDEFREFCEELYDDAYDDGKGAFVRQPNEAMIAQTITDYAEKEIVTCVYCGHAYPPGTPTANHPLLTEHIAQCEKHPMRAVTEQRDKLLALCERFLRAMPHHRLSEDLENEFVRVVRDCGGNA